MYEKFVAERIAQLRTQKGVSGRDMSLSLGQSEGYINKIENQHAEPSQQGLYAIMEYFGVTPNEFYDSGIKYPAKLHKVIGNLTKLSEAKLDHVDAIVEDMVEIQ